MTSHVLPSTSRAQSVRRALGVVCLVMFAGLLVFDLARIVFGPFSNLLSYSPTNGTLSGLASMAYLFLMAWLTAKASGWLATPKGMVYVYVALFVLSLPLARDAWRHLPAPQSGLEVCLGLVLAVLTLLPFLIASSHDPLLRGGRD